MSTMLDHALAWAARGFRVFPLRPGSKFPLKGYDWRELATTNTDIIAKVWKDTNYNIGVLCNDLVVVDCDVKGKDSGLLSYLEQDLPTDTLTVATPSGGLHYYLSGADCRNRTRIFPGVDIRSHHGYVLAPGSRTAAGSYTIVNDVDPIAAPAMLVEQIGAPVPRIERNPLVELDTDANLALARDWLLEVAPKAIEGEGGDHTTYRVACGVRDFGISEDATYELLLEHWNDGCEPPWDDAALRVKVENAFCYATGAQGAKTPEAEFAGVEIAPAEYKARRATKWIDAGDPVDFDRQWLMYNRFPQVGTALCVAPSNAGKTFLSLELAKSIATGSEFFGVAPDLTGAAIILAAEGVAGLSARMGALDRMKVSALPVSMLGDPATAKAVASEIEEKLRSLDVPLRLIVVDTLTASGLLTDENNNSECGRAVKALEEWSRRFNCLVMVNHHPPKNGTGARGGSALHAGFDTVVEVHYDGKPVRFVECSKGRDAPTGKWGSFTLIPRTLGFDRKGREITTCEVSMGSEARPSGGKEPKYQGAFMEAFDIARVNAGLGKSDPVPRDALRKVFAEVAHLTGKANSGNATTHFKRCLDWAETAATITLEGDTVNDIRPSAFDPQ